MDRIHKWMLFAMVGVSAVSLTITAVMASPWITSRRYNLSIGFIFSLSTLISLLLSCVPLVDELGPSETHTNRSPNPMSTLPTCRSYRTLPSILHKKNHGKIETHRPTNNRTRTASSRYPRNRTRDTRRPARPSNP